mgnify:CR=1 FL=1
MWTHYNPNPAGRNVGDCTVRALSKALDQDWYTTYLGLCVEGGLLADMPSANAVWGAYLRRHGFRRELAPEDVTVAEFADSQDCVLYDSWDSRNEIVLYYWQKG